MYDYIRTPLFVLNSMYDTTQLSLPCLEHLDNCSDVEINFFDYFKAAFDVKMQPVLNSMSSNGYFFDSCLAHCQATADECWTKYATAGHPMRESFADWYYERPSPSGATRVKDCDIPCNPTCPIPSPPSSCQYCLSSILQARHNICQSSSQP